MQLIPVKHVYYERPNKEVARGAPQASMVLTAGYAAEVHEDILLKSAAKREHQRAAELLRECYR